MKLDVEVIVWKMKEFLSLNRSFTHGMDATVMASREVRTGGFNVLLHFYLQVSMCTLGVAVANKG